MIFGCFRALPKTALSKMILKVTSITHDRDKLQLNIGTNKQQNQNLNNNQNQSYGQNLNSLNLNENNENQNKDNNDENCCQLNDEQFERMHKEEKAIGILRSTERTTSFSSTILFSVLGGFIIAFTISLYVVMAQYFDRGTNDFLSITPQVINICDSYSTLFVSVLFLHIGVWAQNGLRFQIEGNPYVIILLSTFASQYLNQSLKYYPAFFFGNQENDTMSATEFIGLDSVQISATSEQLEQCLTNLKDTNHDDHTIATCLNADNQYFWTVTLIKRFISEYITPWTQTGVSNVRNDDERLLLIYHLAIDHLYGRYFGYLMNYVNDQAQLILQNSKTELIWQITIFFILLIITTVIFIFTLIQDRTQMKQTLYLLLHAPSEIIIK